MCQYHSVDIWKVSSSIPYPDLFFFEAMVFVYVVRASSSHSCIEVLGNLDSTFFLNFKALVRWRSNSCWCCLATHVWCHRTQKSLQSHSLYSISRVLKAHGKTEEEEENGRTSPTWCTRPHSGIIPIRDTPTPVPQMSNPSFRLWLFLTDANTAMQCERFKVLLGPDQSPFMSHKTY